MLCSRTTTTDNSTLFSGLLLLAIIIFPECNKRCFKTVKIGRVRMSGEMFCCFYVYDFYNKYVTKSWFCALVADTVRSVRSGA